MRFPWATAGFLLFAWFISSAQDQIRSLSSTPLPKSSPETVWGGGEAGRLGCGQDGTFLLPQSFGTERAAPIIARLSANGTLLAVVDAERVPGLGRTSIEDFAPGPNGETYLMA